MAEMIKVSEWYDPESNKWFMVFQCDEDGYRDWEEEIREIEEEEMIS